MSVFGLFEFFTPEALWLLLLLPVWWLWRRIRRRDAIVFSRTAVLAAGPKVGSWVPPTIFTLRNVALAFLIVALARPRSGAHTETQTSEGINIVLAIDLSSSMLALDFRPNNRIEVAKAKVKQFIARRSSDRIGIVAFAGDALTEFPLTTDYRVVMQAVSNLQAGQLEDGTAIGNAIATAANRLRDAPGKSRVIILLTDGVNNRGTIEPLVAAKAAEAYGIKVYGIGVGSVGMAPVPVGRNAAGGLRYEYQPVAIVLPVVAAWLVRWGLQARRDRLARLGTPSMVARLAPSVTQQRTSSAIVRAGLATLLIAIAIAGPRWGVEQTVVKQQGVDVVLALDASASMLATDEKPSRLQAMKQEINRLRDLSPGDRFALLAFAGRSYILTPLTVDNSALDLYLQNLDPSIVVQGGSSPASALRQATNLLALNRSQGDKAIILMSDGEGFDNPDVVLA